jgi:integrin alpha FG-GAP repeat containing protein 1
VSSWLVFHLVIVLNPDRDGTIDIIFPTCARQSNSAGTGSDCSINIAYNRQVPICSGLNSETTNNGAAEQGKLSCRGWGELCVSDPDFSFSFDQGDDVSLPEEWIAALLTDQAFVTIPFSTLFSSTDSEPGILLHAPGDSAIPLPIRPGDYNVDGFPDLLITISNSSARHSSGVFGGSAGTQVRVIENIACRKGIAGCEGNQKRGFRVKRGKGWEVLDHLTDVTGASWIDLDDDVG